MMCNRYLTKCKIVSHWRIVVLPLCRQYSISIVGHIMSSYEGPTIYRVLEGATMIMLAACISCMAGGAALCKAAQY